jgi:replicative superfamily II helicase
MLGTNKETHPFNELRGQLKALSNRYAVEILQALNPASGDIVPTMGWDDIVQGILALHGIENPEPVRTGEKTQAEVKYEKKRRRLVSGGTLYESMSKLVKEGFVQAIGPKRKKQRKFMITHDGRLALSAVESMHGPSLMDAGFHKAAKLLLKHKNFTRLLFTQERFVREFGETTGNLIIQMPPGSGKTFLAIAVILTKLEEGAKCVYLSPYMSLSRQVIDEYGELIENLGYSVIRYDGRYRATDKELDDADLVVGMYESVLGSLLENKKWVENISLVIVDEFTELDSMVEVQANNLGTDRSTKLDCLTALLKENCQVITLSSRFGETEEIANWLNAQVFRPNVRLQPDEFIVTRDDECINIVSCDGTQRDAIKTQSILEAIFEHIDNPMKKAVLVVVGWREGTEGVARYLAKTFPRNISSDVVEYIVGNNTDLPVAQRLRVNLQKGVAFHHAGLNADVRSRLERSINNGDVCTVVSTTGITSGTSFPFDCIIIQFETIGFYISRSRYLQIAGRIGEYHLAKYGGAVYLVYEGRTRQFPKVELLEKELLHEPLEPLEPGPLYPSLAADLIMRTVVNHRNISRKKTESAFMKIVEATLRGSQDPDYVTSMKNQFRALFNWLVKNKALISAKGNYKMEKEAKAAVLAGLSILEYIQTRDTLSNLSEDTAQSDLLDLVLHFNLPQSMRPRTFMPSDIELKIAGLSPPEEWYLRLVKTRERIKKEVIEDWLDEQNMKTILEHADETAREKRAGRTPAAGSDLGEGDVAALAIVCSDKAKDLAEFFKSVQKKGAAKRLDAFSNQLYYGLRKDLAGTDLFDIRVPVPGKTQLRMLSKSEVRTLFEHGYATIKEVVRKDIDSQKEGLARDRFAQNCGLEIRLAKEVYKSAISVFRARHIESS